MCSITLSSSRTLPFQGKGHQDSNDFFIDALKVFLELRVVFLDEMIDQQRNVLGPVAQRRDMDLHDVKPIVKILAEAVFLDLFF